jgi:hypothetical protein
LLTSLVTVELVVREFWPEMTVGAASSLDEALLLGLTAGTFGSASNECGCNITFASAGSGSGGIGKYTLSARALGVGALRTVCGESSAYSAAGSVRRKRMGLGGAVVSEAG